MNEHSQTADTHRATDGTVTVYCLCGAPFSDRGEYKARRNLAVHIQDELDASAMDASERDGTPSPAPDASIGEAPSPDNVRRPVVDGESSPAAPVPLPLRKRRNDVHAYCLNCEMFSVSGSSETVAAEAATRHCIDTGHHSRVIWSGQLDIQSAPAITGEVASGPADVRNTNQ